MPKFHSLKIQEIRKETEDCVSISFEVPEGLQSEYEFTQGQYLTLRTQINGAEVRRSYSICTSPNDDDLRVAIKKLEGGQFSTFANETLAQNDLLDVMTPMGNFYTPLHADNEKHYVAFVAGSGITPILSILKTTLVKEPKSHFTLFYGNRYSDSIIFKEQIEALKNLHLGRLSVHHILSQEHPGSELFYGRIDEAKCHSFCKYLFDPATVDEFFLCGPESMINAIRETLSSLGVDEKNIHFELFTSPVGKLGDSKSQNGSTKSVLSKITITLDDNTFEVNLNSTEDTILDAAHKMGADLPYACKGGVCCTCKAKVLEGEVEMEINYGLEPEEVEAGYVLTCQSHPKTPKVVVSFDE